MKSKLTTSSIRIYLVVIVICLTCGLPSVLADDWPQILGPDRNGISKGEVLLDNWPDDGPQKLWSHPVGEGYAGPVVAKGKVIIFHRVKRDHVVDCLDAASGKVIWKQTLPATYQSGGIDSDTGPKCVPLIHKDKIILFGAAGNLLCINFKDGKSLWTRALADDFSAPLGYFGAGATPIVADNKVLVNIGGDGGAIVALNVEDGETVWKSGNDRASYSSPVKTKVGDQELVVFVTRLKAIGLNPTDGKVLFEMPFGKRGPTVNGANPIVMGDQLFLNSAYNVGAKLLEMEPGKDGIGLKTKWSNDSSFSSQYSTPVVAKGHFFGTAGREDFGNGSFRCVEVATGKVKWTSKMPVGHTILAGEKMLVQDTQGNVYLVAANSEKYQLISKHRVFKSKSRAIPALSNGRMYLRSNGPRGELVCLQVGQGSDR